MLGVELVTDRQLKTPAKVETLHVMDQMKGKPFCQILLFVHLIQPFLPNNVTSIVLQIWEC